MTSLQGQVGLFFYANGTLLLHTCPLEKASHYGDFLNYPLSHDTVWTKRYLQTYHVDFDYYPRGRIVYNSAENVYTLFFDGCMKAEAEEMAHGFGDAQVILMRDEHYQCHGCNEQYTYITQDE